MMNVSGTVLMKRCYWYGADPYTPDVLAITAILREEAGQPQSIQKECLLQQLPEASPFRNMSSALA